MSWSSRSPPSLFDAGEAINIALSGPRPDDLIRATTELKQAVADYDGVMDVTDDFRQGKREVRLNVTPEGETLGISMAGLSRQVRQAFYGEEAQRIQRGRDDVRVMVRYPESERRSLGDMEKHADTDAGGIEVPFFGRRRLEEGRGYSNIRRTDRRRVITVTADVNDAVGNANDILNELTSSYLPALMAKYPGLTYTLEGEQRTQQESIDSLGLWIDDRPARYLRTAGHSLQVLHAAPDHHECHSLRHRGGRGGARHHGIPDLDPFPVWHRSPLRGRRERRPRAGGLHQSQAATGGIRAHLREIIRIAGIARFRPVLLTSLTTFAGLTPILLERSLQAQFLIPMAISLGFGVLFATAVTLI